MPADRRGLTGQAVDGVARIAATFAALWSVWAVGHAIVAAGAIAESAGARPMVMLLWGLFYLVPLLLTGGWLLVRVGRTGEAGGDTVLRSLRMGVTTAVFGVLLSWGLVLYASYLGVLVKR